jgi:hypothetical protein
VLLVPMGFINERHEPTTFVSTNRPYVERNLLPSTWRELGAGFWGSAGPVDWRAYAITGLDAFDFKASGLRDGRQNAAKAVAEDFALVGRADWHALEWLDLSGSVYWGDSGQERVGADVGTLIWEAHAEARWRSFSARALYVQSELDDVAARRLNGFTGNVGRERRVGYVEPPATLRRWLAQRVEPFVRWETYDTQAAVPSGFSSNPANDVDVLTFGVAYRPMDAIVFKLDYSDFDNGANNAIDRLTLGMGFVF